MFNMKNNNLFRFKTDLSIDECKKIIESNIDYSGFLKGFDFSKKYVGSIAFPKFSMSKKTSGGRGGLIVPIFSGVILPSDTGKAVIEGYYKKPLETLLMVFLMAVLMVTFIVFGFINNSLPRINIFGFLVGVCFIIFIVLYLVYRYRNLKNETTASIKNILKAD